MSVSLSQSGYSKACSILLAGPIFVMLSGCVAEPGPEAAESGAETAVAVWYVTDRARDGAAGYGDGRADITHGVADIRIPPGHVSGRLEEPALASAGHCRATT